MDLLDLLLQVGDRVRVIQGELQGKAGTITKINHEKKSATVKGDNGGTRTLPLIYLAHLPTLNGGATPPPEVAAPPGPEVLTPPPEVAAPPLDIEATIATLEALCTNLSSTALTDCWIENWKRGGGQRYRLHFHASTERPCEYLSKDDAIEIQKRIDAGRQLKTLRAAIEILRKQINE